MLRHTLRTLLILGIPFSWDSAKSLRFALNNRQINLTKSTRLKIEGCISTRGYIYLGPNVEITVAAGGELHFGGNNYLLEGSNILVGPGEHMVIGQGTTIDRFCTLIGDIVLGNQCILAPQVFISSHKHLYNGEITLSIRELDYVEPESKRMVRVDEQVWIGYSSVILPNTHLGKRTVVGALSKVQGDYKEGFFVLNGNPASIVKLVNSKKSPN